MHLFRKHTVPILLSIGALGLTVYFLFFRHHLGMVRFFDADEYAYLYWTRHMLMGYAPYKDFFQMQTPGYVWFLSPIFFWAQGVTIFFLSRSVAFWVFAALIGIISLIYWRIRKSWTVVFVPLILTFLPMPLDKFIETRPDTLSFVLTLVGTYLVILWMQRANKKFGHLTLFFAGICFSSSVIVLSKVVPQIALTSCLLLVLGIYRIRQKEMTSLMVVSHALWFIMGGLIPILGMFLWVAVVVGDIALFWYSITTMSVEASQLGRIFYINPEFFFMPNDVYYGRGGWHIGNLTNNAIWLFGMIVACVEGLFLFRWRRFSHRVIELICIFGLLLNILLYVYFFPLKHAQYLIIPAVFVCFYAADGLRLMWEVGKRTKLGSYVYGVMICSLYVIFFIGFRMVNQPKLIWVNTWPMTRFKEIHTQIPASEPVLDLMGLTLDYPLGYVVTCLPFGQFSQFLTRPLPPLIPELIARDVKYIFQGDIERLSALSYEDQTYIEKHFTRVREGDLYVRNDVIRSFSTFYK